MTTNETNKITGYFVPSMYGINIRVDNRVKGSKIIIDKKNMGFLKCNQAMFNRIKNDPAMKDFKFFNSNH